MLTQIIFSCLLPSQGTARDMHGSFVANALVTNGIAAVILSTRPHAETHCYEQFKVGREISALVTYFSNVQDLLGEGASFKQLLLFPCVGVS
jgi:predicted naringenin-chalcone synthase